MAPKTCLSNKVKIATDNRTIKITDNHNKIYSKIVKKVDIFLFYCTCNLICSIMLAQSMCNQLKIKLGCNPNRNKK